MGRLALLAGAALAAAALTATRAQPPAPADFSAVRPILNTYCLNCHSAEKKKGSLDLERFASTADIRKDVKVWEQVAEQVEAGEMPPKGGKQMSADERKRLVAWVRGFLDGEARARAGDPGRVPLRRLSNAEFDYTVRDLTGVNLRPAREFPADGAAGEGFTNAAEALADVSPALFDKYLAAAKEIADHAVLLPDGFRFSPAKTRRDWTDEATAALRRFYAQAAPPDGKLNPAPYLAASVKHRDKLLAGKAEEVAAAEKLNPKYLAALVRVLSDKAPSHPLDGIRAKWRTAAEKDIPALVSEVTAWQAALWATTKVGSYMRPVAGGYALNEARQLAVDVPALAAVPLRVKAAPAPGQKDVTLTLEFRELTGEKLSVLVWERPRFEAAGKPTLLLSDYPAYGAAFELNPRDAFANSAKYLAAVAKLAHDATLTPDAVAQREKLHADFLHRWAEFAAVPVKRAGGAVFEHAAAPLELLTEKAPPPPGHPTVSGWRKAGTDLPVVVANSGDKEALIPGRVAPRGVSMHPLPQEAVAVVWKSSVEGAVRLEGLVAHAHPACGNGVAWRLEHRRGGRAAYLQSGVLDVGKSTRFLNVKATVEKGDQLALVVDARDGNHVCDMTSVEFSIYHTTKENGGLVWSLGGLAPNITAANPHADGHDHLRKDGDGWSFARVPSKAAPVIPSDSLLGRWRVAAADPAKGKETAELAARVEALLFGPRPADAKSPDRAVYDRLVSPDSPLLAGVDLAKLVPLRRDRTLGVPHHRDSPIDFIGTDFGTLADRNFITIRVPASLPAGREFVVDARFGGTLGNRVYQVKVNGGNWAPAVIADPKGKGYAKLKAGAAAFREAFPLYLCFPNVVPTDEVVSLKMFHREDEPLRRLFLNDAQAKQLDHLWNEHRFVSRQPVAEDAYLPQFIGFVTQDQPKAMENFFRGLQPAFRAKADAFLADEAAAAPKQLDALLAFAARAYRRPLAENEKDGLLALYRTVRAKGAGHDEAFRGVLARVLVSPAFLFRVERAPPGRDPGPVNDWELATRLSYFLWASAPDDELRALAAEGKLRDPAVLAAQAERMLKDNRVRALAIEFGTQWIHVRGFDELKEKNEALFPTFDAKLRGAIYEESIRFFDDFFREGRPVLSLLDADHTFVNDALAKHYGIPNVNGTEFRRIDGVRKYGRGGVLGLASVQARQSGASRTSPVLRGNWVVETLLGEKLPRPPANVPPLPETEGADKLTMRQQVERHAKEASCAACHVRIDPFGFALEKYDPIGRLREKDLGGLPLDTKATLRDGTTFDGIDGLRNYLLTTKRDVVVRLFCRRLLGYALGRSVTLSDTALLDEMVAELNRNDGRVTAAVRAIVRSPQFRMVRGRDAE